MVSLTLLLVGRLLTIALRETSNSLMLLSVGERNPNMESLYEYGSRAGFWRFHRLFTSRKIPITVFAVGMVSAFRFILWTSTLNADPLTFVVVQLGIGTESCRVSCVERNPRMGSSFPWLSMDRLSQCRRRNGT
jgi:hypothetical protein